MELGVKLGLGLFHKVGVKLELGLGLGLVHGIAGEAEALAWNMKLG